MGRYEYAFYRLLQGINELRKVQGSRLLKENAPQLAEFLEKNYKGYYALSPSFEEIVPDLKDPDLEHHVLIGGPTLHWQADIHIQGNQKQESSYINKCTSNATLILEAKLVLPDRNDGKPIWLRQYWNRENPNGAIEKNPTACEIPFP